MNIEFQIEPNSTRFFSRSASGHFRPGSSKATDGRVSITNHPTSNVMIDEGEMLAEWAEEFHALRLYLRRLV